MTSLIVTQLPLLGLMPTEPNLPHQNMLQAGVKDGNQPFWRLHT